MHYGLEFENNFKLYTLSFLIKFWIVHFTKYFLFCISDYIFHNMNFVFRKLDSEKKNFILSILKCIFILYLKLNILEYKIYIPDVYFEIPN